MISLLNRIRQKKSGPLLFLGMIAFTSVVTFVASLSWGLGMLLQSALEWGILALSSISIAYGIKKSYDYFRKKELERLAHLNDLSESYQNLAVEYGRNAASYRIVMERIERDLETVERLTTDCNEQQRSSNVETDMLENPMDDLLIDHDDPELRCPISGQIMQDPVIANDNQTYDRFFLQLWFDKGNHSCPINQSATLTNPELLRRNEVVWEKIIKLVQQACINIDPHLENNKLLKFFGTSMSSFQRNKVSAYKARGSVGLQTESTRMPSKLEMQHYEVLHQTISQIHEHAIAKGLNSDQIEAVLRSALLLYFDSEKNFLTDALTGEFLEDPRILPSGFTVNSDTVEDIYRLQRRPFCLFTQEKLPTDASDLPRNLPLIKLLDFFKSLNLFDWVRNQVSP